MPMVICKNCSKPFEKRLSEIKNTNNNFCSRSCAAIFNNKGKQKNPPKLRTCKKCGKQYYFSRKKLETSSKAQCPECLNLYKLLSEMLKTLTLADYHKRDSIKNKHPSWKNAHIRGLNRSWNKDLLKFPCQVCDYDKHIELCHKKSISDFPETATLGEINHSDNNYVLCPNHHWEYDNKIIFSENIPERITPGRT
jgi:hypothetical protein